MRCAAFPLVLILGLAMVSRAIAAVPVSDAAQLERKAETSKTTVELKSVVLDQSKKRAGVTCAVTKGGKGSVQNPASQPDTTKGSNAIKPYGPDLPATPEPGATGGALNEQTLGATAGKVVAGVDASQSTVTATRGSYRARSGEVGTSQTVMAALDQNSSIRIQNGMSWNQAMNAANLLVQSLNAFNLAGQSDASQAAGAMPQLTTPATTNACPTGYSGAGTASDPCRPASCSTVQGAAPSDGACIARRYLDADGNVRVYLERVTANYQIPASPDTTATGSISQADVDAALTAIRASSRP